MKLHLPSALRKALLACLVAFSLPVSLPTTLGTASGIAAAWLLSSQQVTAVSVTWTYGAGTTDTEQVECSGTEYTIKVDGSGGLGDLQLSSSEGDLTAGAASYGNFWTNTDGGLYNTLHVKADSQLQENGTISCDWAGYFNLGGLIIDALSDVNGQPRELLIGRTTGEGQHIRFQAENDEEVKVRIGTSTALYGSSVKLSSNGDWVIGAGKTLEFKHRETGTSNGHQDDMDPQFLVAAGKTLTLSKNSQDGVGNLTTDLLVVSEGNIIVGNGIHAEFQNGLTISGGLTLEQGSQLTLSGVLALEETATLTVSEGGTLTLGDDVTLDLLTNEVLDDSWSFTWGVQGLDEATLERLLAGATINGAALSEGASLELSDDGRELHLVGGSSQPSEPTPGEGTVTWTDVGGTEQVECSGTEYVVESDGGSAGLVDFKLSGLDAGNTSLGKFWSGDGDGTLHDTFHITANSAIGNNTIRCDWGGFFNLGALIVDATDNTYIFDNHTGRNSIDGQRVRFSAEGNGDVQVRIGSSTTIECASVKLSSDGDWVIGGGKTFELTYLASKTGANGVHTDSIDNQFLVTAGKTLTLSKNSQEGVGTFNVAHQVVSEGNITVRDGIHANFRGGMELSGALTLESGSQLTLSGVLALEETATLTVNEGGTLTLGDDVTLDLLTNEVLDNSWSFTWGVQGLDDQTLERLLAGATINGEALGDGMSLELSEDGREIRLVGGSGQPGGGVELRKSLDRRWCGRIR